MMRLLLSLCVWLVLTASAAAQTPDVPPPPPPTLSALHQAQAEAHLAKLRVLQLEVQLRQQALAEERARLEQALAAAHPGYRMDWERGQLVAQPAEPPR